MRTELKTILNHGIITIEDMQRLTTAELILKIVNKVNLMNDELSTFFSTGVKEELTDILTKWKDDGTIAVIIDEELARLKNKIDNLEMINVKDYGVVGDGIKDDTEALQSLINVTSNYVYSGDDFTTYQNVKPVKLYLPKGKYVITDTINLAPYIHLCGDFTSIGNNYRVNETGAGVVDFKNNGTVLVCKFKTVDKFALNVSAYHTNGTRDTNINRNFNAPSSQLYDRLEGVTIENITIKAENHLFGGIYLLGSPFTTISNVNILGSDIGIYIRGSWNVRINQSGLHCKNYGIFTYADVNNVSIDGCSIEHYYMYSGNGKGDRTYTVKTLPLLYPSEGEHMPESYVSLTTGIYSRNTWQMTVSNTTIQNFERGIYAMLSNMKLDSVWFEGIKTVDIHDTHGVIQMNQCRKETNQSKLIRATGGANVLILSLSGSNDRGNFIPDLSKLIDYKDGGAIVTMLGNPVGESLNISPLNVEELAFNGGNSFKLAKITITPAGTTSSSIPFPKGFDKYNTNVVSIKRFRANNVIVTEPINNLTMDNNGINFTPQEAVKHEIIILRVK